MYRFFLLSFILVIIVFKPIFIKVSKEGHHSYLYVGATNLNQHNISLKTNKSKIVFLGNSSVAGSNIPEMNNISDQLNLHLQNHQSFNLGVLGASTTTLLTLFELSLDHKPDVFIFGINPGLFANSESGFLEWSNLELIRPMLSPAHLELILSQKKQKDLISFFDQKKSRVAYPPKELLKLKSKIFKLKEKIYGPTMSTEIFGKRGAYVTKIEGKGKQNFDVLKSILTKAKKRNFKVIAYFDPIYKSNSTFNRDDFNEFKSIIKKELSSIGVSLLDYTDKLESTSSNFLDYIHLNPAGNEAIAKIMARDLKELGID